MEVLHAVNMFVSPLCPVDPVQREGIMDSHHTLHFLSVLPGRC